MLATTRVVTLSVLKLQERFVMHDPIKLRPELCEEVTDLAFVVQIRSNGRWQDHRAYAEFEDANNYVRRMRYPTKREIRIRQKTASWLV